MTRRDMLARLTAGAALAALGPRLRADESRAAEPDPFAWVNQRDGPRPRYVWENREDVIYHDLSYGDPAIQSAPEFAAFMGRSWVFNRAMQWHRQPEGILCYCAPGSLMLTGDKAVSAWQSDPTNELVADGDWTVFRKCSTARRRDCAVLPALQFHLGQNPVCELEVSECSDDWQFVVSVKGRGGPPLLASAWQSGPGRVRFDLAAALKRKGFNLNFAELHFVIGTWAKSAQASSAIRFRLKLPGQPAVVAALPVVATTSRARSEGAPVLAAVVDAAGTRLTRSEVRVRALVAGRKIELEERDGFWRARIKDLPPGDYPVRLTSAGKVRASSSTWLRITDGDFWTLAAPGGAAGSEIRFSRRGQVTGPLSGSYQGNVFVRAAGSRRESLVQGQKAWNAWDRKRPPGEHLHYWEGLTSAEMDARFRYLASCGWDLLHVCQHWGIWERLDAGGRIAPHGAEQMALYFRTASRHDLAVIQALTHYEYVHAPRDWHGTIPFTTYLEAGFQTDDFFQPGRNARFEQMFHRYLLDYVTLFRDETALFAMTASGEGDATIGHARCHDVFDFVRAHDTQHLFFAEPTLILTKTPRQYTQGWSQDLFGARTYFIGNDFSPLPDLDVEFRLYRLGSLALAEGSWATSGLYAGFYRDVLKDSAYANGSWTGTSYYRRRLRDSLYLGLVQRLSTLMTWDEQIAEDEHRLVRQLRQQVDWTQVFAPPPVAVRLAGEDLGTDQRRTLIQYQQALDSLRLDYCFLHREDPVPEGVQVVLDAAQPFVAPAYASEGGSLPDALKSVVPLEVSPEYSVSYAVSADRTTLLAYLANHGVSVERTFKLGGRLHRQPAPARLHLRLRNLAAEPLRLRLYDLEQQREVRNLTVTGDYETALATTTADFFLLVTRAQ